MHYFTKFRFVFGISIVASILSKFRPRSDRSGKVDKSVFWASSHHVKLQFIIANSEFQSFINHSSSVWSCLELERSSFHRPNWSKFNLECWFWRQITLFSLIQTITNLKKMLVIFWDFVNFFDICLYSYILTTLIWLMPCTVCSILFTLISINVGISYQSYHKSVTD